MKSNAILATVLLAVAFGCQGAAGCVVPAIRARLDNACGLFDPWLVFQQCPHCRVRVIPRTDGTCTNCDKNLAAPVEATAGSEDPPLARYGDRAGEFRQMMRGRYSAWLYVALGFLLIVAAFWAPLYYGTIAIVQSKLPSLTADHYEWHRRMEEIGTGAFIVSVLIAMWIFNDRWRCIEATTSRYCSGVMNLSILYVPVVAALYAFARGVEKVFGR